MNWYDKQFPKDREHLSKLENKPCECIRCLTCDGTGYINDLFDHSGFSDEICMDCDSDGLSEICDRCHEIEELEWEAIP